METNQISFGGLLTSFAFCQIQLIEVMAGSTGGRPTGASELKKIEDPNILEFDSH